MFQGQGGGARNPADPFARMNRMMDQMFGGGGGLFGGSPFSGSPFFNDPFFRLPPPQWQHRQHGGAEGGAAVIEEVQDGHEGDLPRAQSNHQPLVEEPDDAEYADSGTEPHGRGGEYEIVPEYGGAGPSQGRNPFSDSFGGGFFPNGGFGDAFSDGFFGGGSGSGFASAGGSGSGSFYSGSYSSYGGPSGGGGYSKSTTVRRGPGGAEEVEDVVNNGNNQTVTRSRRIGNHGRTTTITRDAAGEETTRESLHGMDAAAADAFDAEWAARSGHLTIQSQQQQSSGGGGNGSGSSGHGGRRIDIV